jgi:hypothetical protein
MALPLGMTAVDNGMAMVLIALLVLPISGIAFARSGRAWKSLGKGRFAIDAELPPKRAQGSPLHVDKAAQAAEVRQMVEAKSYRHRALGQAPIDVEAEVRRALDPRASSPSDVDAELRAEVRQLVIVRNERRLSRGDAPLDVDDEVEKQLSDFIGSD